MKHVLQGSRGASRTGLHRAHTVEIRISSHTGRGIVRTVFGDVVEVVPTDDDSAGHLRRDDATSEDATTDRHFASERTLLV